MLSPELEGLFSLLEELVPLVHGGHSRDRAALVVQDLVRDMRRDPEPRHARDHSAPQIMQRPVAHA